MKIFSAEINENDSVGKVVQELDVVNQDVDKRVDCFFVSGNDDGKFALNEATDGKDCTLVTNDVIDREKQSRYDLVISVRYRTSRRKRQSKCYCQDSQNLGFFILQL